MVVCAFIFGLQAKAAEIVWLELLPADVPEAVGEVIEAINLGGPAVANVNGIDFLAGDGGADPPMHSNVFDLLTSSWGGPTGAGDFVEDPGLAEVISTGRWIGSGATQEVELINLTPGTTYLIQLYTGDQRDCCGNRFYHFEDGLGNASPTWSRNSLMTLLGQFTADSETQIMTMFLDPGASDPHLTAYVLSLASPPTLAANPTPAMDANDVLRDSALSWSPSKFAGAHNVYLGASFEDVNSGTVPTAANLDVNSFDPGRLDFGQTYFWRVDEVNATPDKTVFKGSIWSFMAEPYSIQIPGSAIAVTASSFSNEFSMPEKSIDGSGLDAHGKHAISPETMWFTASVDLDPWIQYEFEDILKLDTMTVWNSNSGAEIAIGWGAKDIVIEYSTDGQNWDILEGANQLSRAPGLPTYDQYDEIDFGGAAAKFVRVNIESNWGGILMSYSLSEVQFSMIPVQARTPDPASGSSDVLPNATVSWRAGREAGQHTIYVSSDQDEVAGGLAASSSSSTNSLDLSSLDLQMDSTYYWRVDEVNEAEATSVWAGPVWSLTTASALIVDDFESYGNSSPNRPFQTWLDGFGYSADEFFAVEYAGNGTGAGIGHDIWSLSSPHYDGDIMETSDTIAGSGQSMPFYYSNSGGTPSETQRTFAVPQDWTVGGAQTLSIAFRGTAGNTGSLYVKINNTRVPFDGHASSMSRPVWVMWPVDLAASGVNLSSVTTIALGVDGGGASGMILIDDITLVPEPFSLSTSMDITTPGDVVQGVPNDDDWPTAESPDLAIDDDTATKYLHRKGGAMATGLQIAPMVGPTVVTGLTLTTANDVPNRDPIIFELSGSNTSIDGPYELIAAGDVVDFAGTTEWPRFTSNETPIEFENTVAYQYYQIVFPTLRGASEALMQISEVALTGAIQ